MRSRVLIFALALSLPVAGCSSGDSNAISPDPNNRGDTGPSGNKGDAARSDGALSPDGWSDFDAGPVTTTDAGRPTFDGFDFDGLDLDGFSFDGGPTGPTPEHPDVCGNGLDDDGNGLADDNCNCVAGRSQRCFLGALASAGRGVCLWGTQTCEGIQTDGTWGACTGSGSAAPTEACDGLDNTCDGNIDETCPCTPGASRPCYSGPGATAGRGACRGGSQVCSTAGRWGTCSGEVTPTAETCDGMDRNCDGSTTDRCVCPLGMSRTCSAGASASLGLGICRPGQQRCAAVASGGTDWGACVGEVFPTAEVCDNTIDDDCNGLADCLDQGCRFTAECLPRCTRGTIENLLPDVAEITLVADRSGSMEARFSDGATRWGALRSAVNIVLPRVEDAFDVGLQLFPIGGACSVPPTGMTFPPSRGTARFISDLMQRIGPDGNTPTRAAIEGVAGYFRAHPTARRRFVLLATDGAPNCGSPVGEVVTALTALRATGVDTFVLGVPGPRDALDAMARAGGRPLPGSTAFYDASTTRQLIDAMNAITGATNSCEYPLPSGLPAITDLAQFRVLLGGVVVPADAANGWSFTDGTRSRLRFNGTSCARLRTGTVVAAVVTYNCPP